MLRFALSPTGEMYLDDLRTALFHYIVARQRGERFIVRIEDGDRERNIEGMERENLDILDLFGIRYDDVAYQSRNLTLHQHMAIKLLQERKAFACFCPPSQPDSGGCEGGCDHLSDAEVIDNPNPFTIRLKTPENAVVFEDPLQGSRCFGPDEIESFVILNRDKSATRDFACAVDDMLHDISLVLRSEKEIENTPKEIAVRDALGYGKNVEYLHLPDMAVGEEERISVKRLLQEGFLPEAIANYLIETGSRPPQEIFTLEEATEWFDLRQLSPTPTPFDIQRLRSLNREHMRRADPKELSRAFGFADADIGELAKRYLEEGSTVGEIRPKIDAIFAPKPFDSERGEAMRTLQAAVKEAPLFDSFQEFGAYLKRATGLEGEELTTPLRLLLTGSTHGPDLAELYPHLKNYLQEIVK